MFEESIRNTIAFFRKIRIIPVLVLDDVERGMRIFEILSSQGLAVAEVTFRTNSAEAIIREANRKFANILIGAGTVLTIENLKRAFGAGARFAVAPGFNPVVVEAAVKNGWPFLPGISCPSQIEQAMNLGVRHFKYFPAESLGGASFLMDIAAPYKHLDLTYMPTGGINPQNVKGYLAMPEVSACGGTWLAKSADVANGAWGKIEALVKEAVAIASQSV